MRCGWWGYPMPARNPRKPAKSKPAIYTPCYTRSMWVCLTGEEIRYAIDTARRMRELSKREGHLDHRAGGSKPFNEKIAFRIQALGQCAELAARKVLGYPMKFVTENFRDADLPDNIEVRLIGRDHYGLRVYPRTDDSRRVVGVVIPPGREREPYRIPGWIKAVDAKRPQWEMAPCGRPPMYAVPQEHLRDPRELIAPSDVNYGSGAVARPTKKQPMLW